MGLAAFPWRAVVIAILFAFGGAVVGVIYQTGVDRERARQQVTQAEANAGASETNALVAGDVADAADRVGQAATHATREAADARRVINAHASAKTRIDPRLARFAVRCVELLRGGAEAAACRSAEDPANAEPRDEPVPAGPSPRS